MSEKERRVALEARGLGQLSVNAIIKRGYVNTGEVRTILGGVSLSVTSGLRYRNVLVPLTDEHQSPHKPYRYDIDRVIEIAINREANQSKRVSKKVGSTPKTRPSVVISLDDEDTDSTVSEDTVVAVGHTPSANARVPEYVEAKEVVVDITSA